MVGVDCFAPTPSDTERPTRCRGHGDLRFPVSEPHGLHMVAFRLIGLVKWPDVQLAFLGIDVESTAHVAQCGYKSMSVRLRITIKIDSADITSDLMTYSIGNTAHSLRDTSIQPEHRTKLAIRIRTQYTLSKELRCAHKLGPGVTATLTITPNVDAPWK